MGSAENGVQRLVMRPSVDKTKHDCSQTPEAGRRSKPGWSQSKGLGVRRQVQDWTGSRTGLELAQNRARRRLKQAGTRQ